MKTYLVKKNNAILDFAVCADDVDDAKTFIPETDCEIGEIRLDVSNAMGIPEARGRHNGVVTRWVFSPTALTGDLL